MKKLRDNRGESLVETLLSMLVISLGLLILVSAITSAGRMNRTAADDGVGILVNRESTTAPKDATVSVYSGDATDPAATFAVEVYGTEDDEQGVWYYERK